MASIGTGQSYINENASAFTNMINTIVSINTNYLNGYDNQFAGNPNYLLTGQANDVMMILNGYNGNDYKTGKNSDLFFKIKKLNPGTIFSAANQKYSDFEDSGGICPYVQVNNTYVQTTINNYINDLASNNLNYQDVLLVDFLDANNAMTTDNNPSEALLLGLYGLYDLLSSSNIKTLLSGNIVTLKIPNCQTVNGKSVITNIKLKYVNNKLTYADNNKVSNALDFVMIESMNLVIDVNDILSNSNFNLFIFRQLLRLYIALFNLNIASNIFKTASDSSVISANLFQDNLNNFQYLIISQVQLIGLVTVNYDTLIHKYNNTVSTTGTNVSQINNQISQINSTSKKFKDMKKQIKTNEDYYANTNTNKSKVSIYEYLSLGFLLLIIILSIILEFSSDSRSEFILSIMIVIVTSISYLVINYLYGKSILETFDTQSVSVVNSILKSGIPVTGTNPTAAVNLNIKYYNTLYYVVVNEYLNSLLAFVGYTEQQSANINLSIMLNNQQLYYNDTLNEMNMESNKLDASSAVVNSSRYASTYRMNLYSNLTLIIAITVIIRSGLSSYNTSVPFYVGILGFILAVISVILFMIETSQRVRTDPKRMYWYADRSSLNNNALKNNS